MRQLGVVRDGNGRSASTTTGVHATPDDAHPDAAVGPAAPMGRLSLQRQDRLASAADDRTDFGGRDVARQGEELVRMGDGRSAQVDELLLDGRTGRGGGGVAEEAAPPNAAAAAVVGSVTAGGAMFPVLCWNVFSSRSK